VRNSIWPPPIYFCYTRADRALLYGSRTRLSRPRNSFLSLRNYLLIINLYRFQISTGPLHYSGWAMMVKRWGQSLVHHYSQILLRWPQASFEPRLHQIHIAGYKYPGRATCIRIQVDTTSGYTWVSGVHAALHPANSNYSVQVSCPHSDIRQRHQNIPTPLRRRRSSGAEESSALE